ncbi:MAG: class I poly(R)-hydroxyalkanoic acid synthase, partial [Hyphomicrobiaceae bacterium]|nr:class I poly(R)-hydroxyalkanoic acid synthase [Hyphomicrobiaceae bacterium]
MAKLAEEGSKALAAMFSPDERGEARMLVGEESQIAFKTLGQVAEKFLANPQKAALAQNELWQGFFSLWTGTLQRLNNPDDKPDIASTRPGDKRFSDVEWDENPLFDFLKQGYLLASRWAENVVETTDGLDEHGRKKAHFYLKQLTDALSPSNYVMTNPALLRETIDRHGENLVEGMAMMAEDIQRGKGQLKIRQSDPTKFSVGKNIATTPGKVVYQNSLMQLIQYEATTEKVFKKPLLIVPPWINKFYILDLTSDKSFIRWAVEQGHTVFVISWVNPDQRHAYKSFTDYMFEGPLAALDVMKSITGSKKADVIGYCVGGTLTAATLGWMAAKDDRRFDTATFFTTQVDFTYAGEIKVFVDEEQIAMIERSMSRYGYMEGAKMATAFNMLRANDLIWPYMVNNYIRGKTPMPFDLLHWNSDSTRMPAANHSFYLRNCYLENNLSQGRLEIAGTRIDMSKVNLPVYDLATKDDHIAPAKSAYIGAQTMTNCDVTYVMAGSGHIAGVINPPAKNKYQFWTGPKPTMPFEDWLQATEEHPGSWWPHWQEWMAAHDDKLVPARAMGNAEYPPLEDAPGSYVKVQS